MLRSATIVGLLAALVIGGTTHSAAAQVGMGEADSHFRDGARYFEAGDFESAIAAFQHAYGLLQGNPHAFLVLFNIGMCQERLFQYNDALQSYQAFLQSAPRNHERYREAQQRVGALEQMLGVLQITSNASNAEVWVDDRRVATLPGDVRVASGRHVVELRARGFAPGRQDVTVAARTTVPLTFRLEQSLGALSPAFALTGAGLALGALGVGIGFGVVAMGERSTIDDRLASTVPTERFQVTQAQIDAMQQNALIADVMFGVAGGLGVAALVLVFLTDWGGPTASASHRPTVLPYASSSEAGLMVGGAL